MQHTKIKPSFSHFCFLPCQSSIIMKMIFVIPDGWSVFIRNYCSDYLRPSREVFVSYPNNIKTSDMARWPFFVAFVWMQEMMRFLMFPTAYWKMVRTHLFYIVVYTYCGSGWNPPSMIKMRSEALTQFPMNFVFGWCLQDGIIVLNSNSLVCTIGIKTINRGFCKWRIILNL